jgi:hypothetical protein
MHGELVKQNGELAIDRRILRLPWMDHEASHHPEGHLQHLVGVADGTCASRAGVA